MARRFKKKSLANEDLLEKLFSGTHIGVEDGWSVGNGPDVYRPQHGYETGTQFDINTSFVSDDPDVLFSTSLDKLRTWSPHQPPFIHLPMKDQTMNNEINVNVVQPTLIASQIYQKLFVNVLMQ